MTFAELIRQGVLEIGDGYRAKAGDFGDDGPIFLRAARLTEHGLDFVDGERFSARLAGRVASKLAQPGDTIITTKGNSVGRAGYVPRNAPAFVYSPHLSYWRSLDHSQLAPGFLRYWARGPQFLTQLHAMAYSTDMAPYLSLADQQRLCISVPPIIEQNSIAEVLAALDDKIAVNERIALTCHNLAQVVLSKAIGETAKVRIRDVAEVTMGSSPPSESYNENELGIPFYQGARDFGFRHPRRRVWCTDPVRVAQSGDTLVSVRAPVGRVNMALERCCIGRGVASLTSRSGTPSLLYHALADDERLWSPFESAGTVFGAINKIQLSDTMIRWPTSGNELVNRQLSSLDLRVTAATRESEVLRALRDNLLPRLISGSLRIRDA